MKSKSDPIPAKIKKEVIERDKGFCQGCGRLGAHLHHIKFRSSGGKHEINNLVTLCAECHDKAHNYREWREFWEQWRDLLYRGE